MLARPEIRNAKPSRAQVFLDYAAPGDYQLGLTLFNLSPLSLLPALDGQPPVLLSPVSPPRQVRMEDL